MTPGTGVVATALVSMVFVVVSAACCCTCYMILAVLAASVPLLLSPAHVGHVEALALDKSCKIMIFSFFLFFFWF